MAERAATPLEAPKTNLRSNSGIELESAQVYKENL